ncbi:MAG TPA: hypothetical protein VGD56_06630 [Gemmatirosa sp.]
MRLRVAALLCGVLPFLDAAPARAQAPAGARATGPASERKATAYRNFDVAVYARVYEVRQMADPRWLADRWAVMSRDLHVGKVYLETHRDTLLADEQTIESAKRFFTSRAVRVAGGITLTRNESNRFETFCYSDPKDRAWVQRVVEYTARHFDEIILDDFFFTSCKRDVEIDAKGARSWQDYRLALLADVARNVIVGPAKRVNPRVRVIVKYPNWYEHFQGLGFDLATGPRIFDGIYTGTETRDATFSAQHLQPYLGYQIFRYFSNIAPGRDGGGWVDPGGMRTLDRYAEQLWVTAFAKAPEITLFDFRQLQRPVLATDRGAWQGQGTSFDFEQVVAPFQNVDGSFRPELTIARAAAQAFEHVDRVVGQLGAPIGVACYRPPHATGEDFLHNFLGMIGIPIDLRPTFPADAPTVLLTESAKFDTAIVARIRAQLRAGRNVVVTSGLVRALSGRGLADIVDLRVSERRALVQDFTAGRDGQLVRARKPILIPQLEYLTNDSWELVGAVDGPNGWPMLHDADYAGGHLYVLTIPDNFADLYALPPEVLARIRQTIMPDLPVRVDGPGQVALFAYDNRTFVVESFLDEAVDVRVVAAGTTRSIRDLDTGEVLAGAAIARGPGSRDPDAGRTAFAARLNAHSYRAFRLE